MSKFLRISLVLLVVFALIPLSLHLFALPTGFWTTWGPPMAFALLALYLANSVGFLVEGIRQRKWSYILVALLMFLLLCALFLPAVQSLGTEHNAPTQNSDCPNSRNPLASLCHSRLSVVRYWRA